MFKPIMKTICVAAALSLAAPVAAFAGELEFEGMSWTTGDNENSIAQIETYDGRSALYLRRTMAALEAEDLGDMVIEYDYASSHQSGFIGVNFRADFDTSNFEQFYTRPHQTGQPDATQYMVSTNGSSTWQLHAGPNEAFEVDLPAQTWIKVRIVAIGDRADIFVGDMSEPLIHVPDLRSTSTAGRVGIYASDRPWMTETGAYFSNITVRAATEDDQIIGEPRETAAQPDGLIDAFEVSEAFKEEAINAAYTLPDLAALDGEWTPLAVENDGIANLARVAPISDGKNTALVRFTVSSDEADTRTLNFGYSDRVRLFVDGKLVYSGNAQWRSRDHRFLGTIALVDSIALHLEPGETEVIAAVSESFGGWGFKASLSE